MSKEFGEVYRLPDGTYTEDVDKYCDTWRELGRDVSSIMDEPYYCWGFDPGLSIAKPNSSNSISMPADMALKIQELVRFKREHERK